MELHPVFLIISSLHILTALEIWKETQDNGIDYNFDNTENDYMEELSDNNIFGESQLDKYTKSTRKNRKELQQIVPNEMKSKKTVFYESSRITPCSCGMENQLRDLGHSYFPSQLNRDFYEHIHAEKSSQKLSLCLMVFPHDSHEMGEWTDIGVLTTSSCCYRPKLYIPSVTCKEGTCGNLYRCSGRYYKVRVLKKNPLEKGGKPASIHSVNLRQHWTPEIINVVVGCECTP